GGVRREVRFGGRRVPSFPPVTGRHLTFTFLRAASEVGTDPQPLRIEELDLPGLAPVTRGATVTVPCSAGPTLQVGATSVRFSLRTSTTGLLDGSALAAQPCGRSLLVGAGASELVATPGPAIGLDTIALRPAGEAGASAATGQPREVAVLDWSSEHRDLEVGAGPSGVLALSESFNPGWEATTDRGATLVPVRVDGWRQAWLLPAGETVTVQLDFTPGRWHRAGLGLGAVALIAVVALACVRPRSPRDGPVMAAAAPSREWEAVLLCVGVPTLLGGAWGLAAGLVALGLRRLLPPRGLLLVLFVVAAACGPAVILSGTPVGGAVAQVLALLALALTAVVLSPVPGRGLLMRRPVRRGDLPREAAQQRLLQQQP
ncbi:MAG TPA: hypothetical protein VF314_16965, partial [Actinomycetes bacterium]